MLRARFVSRVRRLLVACCHADLLRLYAPDMPYEADVLKVRARAPRLRSGADGGVRSPLRAGDSTRDARAVVPPPLPACSQDVFELIVMQLPGLEDVDGPSYGRYIYLLERLAVVQSFVLMVDLKCDDLIQLLYETIFNAAKYAPRPSTHQLDPRPM